MSLFEMEVFEAFVLYILLIMLPLGIFMFLGPIIYALFG